MFGKLYRIRIECGNEKKMSEAYYIGKLAIALARLSHTNKQDLEFTCKHELVKSVDNFRNHILYLKINLISEKSFDGLKTKNMDLTANQNRKSSTIDLHETDVK